MLVSVTGSGRDLVELKVGADINIDEITAQGLGAQILDPEVDTIFEIGGQDSKYIRLENGYVTDFEMNRICAAGTGAFVTEAAKIFGAPQGKAMDDLAFASEQPAFISNRCCVFAKSDMVSFLNSGVPKSDVAAGTIYAIVKNYLTLVVGNRNIGKHILFLGGLAKNSQAVIAALKNLKPDISVSVVEGCEVSGAIGAAHVALRELRAGRMTQTRFRGFSEKDINEPAGNFICHKCSNLCSIQKWEMLDGSLKFTGSICGRYENEGNGKQSSGHNFVEDYLNILKEYEKSEAIDHGRGIIGVPRSLSYYEQGPIWLGFLQELGFQVIISESSHEVLKAGNLNSVSAEVCLPIKALIGHVAQLKGKGIRRIFLPTIVETQRRKGAVRSDSCMLIQATVDSFLKSSFPELEFVSPIFHYRGQHYYWGEALMETGRQLGFSSDLVERALRRAQENEREMTQKKRELGEKFLQRVEQGEPSIVLMGRYYSFCQELDMGIPRHFSKLGAHVAPLFLLPIDEHVRLGKDHFDLIFKSSQDLVMASQFIMKQKSNLLPVIMNQFLCRQDSSVVPFITKMMEGRPQLQLALDENAGDIGFRTRCAAFWNVMINHIQAASDRQALINPFSVFIPDKRLRRWKGTVWVSPAVRFFCAGFESLGMRTRFLPYGEAELIERGRKHFPYGEPCLPFIQLAGALEKLSEDPEFDPNKDLLHVAGTRHCASTTLPHLIKSIMVSLGMKNVQVVSPRDGFDVSEAIDTFGIPFAKKHRPWTLRR